MNAGQLVTAVEARSGVGYDPTATKAVINEALADVASEERWPWLQGASWSPTIVAGTATYTPPTGWTDIRNVTVSGSVVPHVHIGEIDDDTTTWGWTVDGDVLVLSPTPGGAETVVVRYDRTEPVLVSDFDTPLLPSQHHNVLINLAASIILERVGELERADRRRADYERGLKRMRRSRRRARGPIAARVRPGAGI